MRIPTLGAGVVAIVAFAVLTLGGSTGQQGTSLPGGIGVRAAAAPADHVGSAACAGCHERQAKDWASSHHAQAMAMATAATVRGDFSGRSVTTPGSKGRFFRDGDGFMVETEGRDGKPATFKNTAAKGKTKGTSVLNNVAVTKALSDVKNTSDVYGAVLLAAKDRKMMGPDAQGSEGIAFGFEPIA